MLKNMKVGTKLIAVLVAPVLVLVILATIGVSQRLDTASSAKRVEELAQMAAADANLANEIQREAIYSAAYMASGGRSWADELATQRKATDAAKDTYNATEDRIDPGKDSDDLKKAVAAVADRLNKLDTQRRSVDGIETETSKTIEQFVDPTSSTSGTLATLNTAIAQAAEDPTLSRGLTTYANLNRLKTAQSNQAALATSFASLTYSDDLPYGYFPQTWPTTTRSGTPCQQVPGECVMYSRYLASAADIAQQEKIFNDAANASQKQLYRDSTAGKKLADYEKQITDTGTVPGTALNDTNSFVTVANGALGDVRSPRIAVNPTTAEFNPLTSPELVTASLDQLDSLKNTENSIITSVLDNAQTVRSDAQQTALLFFIGAVGAIVIALIIAFYVARAVTVPLKKLTSAAYTLSTDKLPALVERLRNPDEATGTLSETLTPIDIQSKDEIGQLADAFNSIQHVTVEVAEEQGALLRKGIGDIFINLARRNQTLLDRQIEFIDQLEANEEDPDQLDNLFKLDHLATRMRRNAESLLVLAGAEPPRRRGRPVALADVVRVAIGEVEDFARISLLALDDVTVGGNVAVDLAHLLSELMENATHFSPPDTTVEIVGHRSDEGYTLSVSDQGIGMSADQLAEANSQLARPPLVGLALSRSLGFIVIGRLASRFGVTVKLTSSSSGGVTALVTLPGVLVTVDGQPMVAPPVEDTPAPPAPVDDVVVVDPETDAAVAADGAAGRELELDEFEQTLAQSDFEAEVASLDAGHRGRRRARGRRGRHPGRRGRRRPGRAGRPRGPDRRAGLLPRRRPRRGRLRARPAVARQRRAGSRSGRRRPRFGSHRAGAVRRRQRARCVRIAPGRGRPGPADRGPRHRHARGDRRPGRRRRADHRRGQGRRRGRAHGRRSGEAHAQEALGRRHRRRHARHGRPRHRRQPALARGSSQDVVPLPLGPQQRPWFGRWF